MGKLICALFVITALASAYVAATTTESVRTWVAEQLIIDLARKPETQAPMYWPEEGKGTRRIYVREYEDHRPPNGAPIFYAPYPETLCMLGMGAEGPRIIYEAKEGICANVVEQFEQRSRRKE